MHLEYFTKVKCEILAAGAVLRSKSLSKPYAIVEISQPHLAQSVQAAAVRESRLSHMLTCCCGIFAQLRYTPVATHYSHNLYYVKWEACLLLIFGKLSAAALGPLPHQTAWRTGNPARLAMTE